MRRRWIPLAAVCLAAALPAAASADTVVSVGDSAISGEAGRWAGNTNQAASKTDALGAGAYNDAGGAEATPGCHRSKSAEVHIGDGVKSVNLACSGARTYSRTSDGKWKPGLDFAVSGANKGQARMLEDLARTDPDIKAVVVLIGANDYGFADILETCVTNWITSPSWWKNYCHDDSNMKAMFSASNISAITNNVRAAFTNLKTAMTRAGYNDSQYEILAQTYSAPLPLSGGMRYPESGWSRQSVGGCGAWNADINWARSTVVDTLNNSVKNAVSGMANVQVLDAVGALYGRRLCENTVGVLEEKGVSTWQSAGAVDKTEWVHQIRTVSTIFGPYQLQEDGHPNYWGQLALRNCFRQAYNGGNPTGGSCARGTGLNAKGEPNMGLN
ncbi:GDSL-type esterase/lipase family protein [Solirubrobacter taibaiensis]|nr:GDSL-type esterase/lipase family protein [Solirubrobacter taibaiensis]